MIDAYGGVHPCASLRINGCNLRQSGLDVIWNGDILREHHHLREEHLWKCTSCPVKDLCYFCPGRAKLCTGNMRVPTDDYCATVKLLAKYATES